MSGKAKASTGEFESIRRSLSPLEAESDSSLLVLDHSDGASTSSTGSLARPAPRSKRKIEIDGSTIQPKSKRLKSHYNDHYRELYNLVVSEILPQSNDSLLASSQIGSSLWSSDEKEVLFAALIRRGRHNIKGIASELQNKSESEIHQYLLLLKISLADNELRNRRPRFLKRPTFDAAFELTAGCVKAQDRTAEALSRLQQKAEEASEKAQYGDMSLLTPSIARWADRRLRDLCGTSSDVSDRLPAADLLNLGNFLRLSKGICMNSAELENNWRSYTERWKAPTMMYTAFSDFHTLAMSITKRLVQSSLFFAMSRVRSSESLDYHCGRHVRQRDVLAAIKVLGMKTDSREHWVGVARRFKLNVLDTATSKHAPRRYLSHDEVEQSLTEKYNLTRNEEVHLETSEGSYSEFLVVASPTRLSENVSDFATSDARCSSDSDVGSQCNDVANVTDDSTIQVVDQQEQMIENYLESIDRQNSQAEEDRLWELLGGQHTKNMVIDGSETAKAVNLDRKDREDLIDWVSRIDYSAGWEILDDPIATLQFEENRRTKSFREENETPFAFNTDDRTVLSATSGINAQDDPSSVNPRTASDKIDEQKVSTVSTNAGHG